MSAAWPRRTKPWVRWSTWPDERQLCSARSICSAAPWVPTSALRQPSYSGPNAAKKPWDSVHSSRALVGDGGEPVDVALLGGDHADVGQHVGQGVLVGGALAPVQGPVDELHRCWFVALPESGQREPDEADRVGVLRESCLVELAPLRVVRSQRGFQLVR